jgi:ABC-type uncharacterized transport system substrate-binding protein
MRKKLVKIAAFALIIALLPMYLFSFASYEDKGSDILPRDNKGEKWRIGYCESEPFFNFAGTLYGVLKGLEGLGWITAIDGIPYESGQADTSVMWKWLSNHDLGPYIEFVEDCNYSLALLPEGTDDIINERLANKHDIDLMLVMGTHAGTALATDKHNVPTMIFSTSNPVKSNIIKSEVDSGRDHVWASTDLERFIRQLKVFHDLFQFKRLGIVYEDTVAGRSFAAVDDVERVAKEEGFEVISYHVDEPKNETDSERYYKELREVNGKLAARVDAYYFTTAAFREVNKTAFLLEAFYDKKIPVFSQTGEDEVRYGALMSLSSADYKGIGQFGSESIARVLNGEKPRKLPQIYMETPKVVINMGTAQDIDYKVPFEVLLTADKVFHDIKTD